MPQSASSRLRQRLGEPGILVQPSAFNAMSARIIEDAGYEVMGLSAASVAATLLGTVETDLVTLDEMVFTARHINAAVDTPLLVDAGNGFGNAINAMRTTEEFIRAGAAGVTIKTDDALLEEAIGKIKACVRVRDERDPDFIIVTCVDGETPGDQANAYKGAGADMMSLDGPVSADELARFCHEIHVPVRYAHCGSSASPSAARLEALGVAMVSWSDTALDAASGAMWDYLRDFQAEDVSHVLRFLDEVKDHPTGNMHEFAGFPAIRALEETYLPKQEVIDRYENSLGYKP